MWNGFIWLGIGSTCENNEAPGSTKSKKQIIGWLWNYQLLNKDCASRRQVVIWEDSICVILDLE